MTKNLTVGKPLTLLFFFALPMVGGNLFQQLYNMVDTMVVGKFVGEDAVAAVGSSYPITFLSIAIANGLSMGSNVVVSQLFGAGRIREMKTTISTALLALGGLGLLVTILGQFIAEPLLRLLGTDADIFASAAQYLHIYFGSALFLFLFNSLNSVYNALGNSRTPLFFLFCAAMINIGLDILFVVKFSMAVAGVAWATFIAQMLCSLASLVVLLVRLRHLPDEEGAPTGKRPIYNHTAVTRIAKIGVPSMFQQSLVSISMLLMQNLVNSFGKVYVAGYTAATKIDSLCLLPNTNFSNAMSSYTAQNIGAGKQERVHEGLRACLFMVVMFAVTITVIIYLFGEMLMALFLNPGEAGSAMSYGVQYMRIVSPFYPLMGILFAGNGLLRGAGDMNFVVVNSLTNLTCRAVLAYLLSPIIGCAAIAWSIPIGWAAGCIVSQLRYHSGAWKGKSAIAG